MTVTLPTAPDTTGAPTPHQIAPIRSGDSERRRRYREHLEFYQGKQWSEPRRRRDRRLTFNYAKTVIEKTASIRSRDGTTTSSARASISA